MKYTDKLGLPIWNKPETDVFDIQEFNEGMQAIDNIVIDILKQINDLVIGDVQIDLNGYVKEEVLKEYAKRTELSKFLTQTDLFNYLDKTYLDRLATKDELLSYAKTDDLSNYATNIQLQTTNNNITNLTNRITNLENSGGSGSGGGTGLTEEQANNIEKIPSIEATVASNSQAIANKADKDHEHTEYLKEIPDEYVTDTELSSKGYATETFVTNKIAEASLSGGDVDLSGYVTDTKLSTELNKKVNKEAGKGLSTNDLTNELVTKINSSATETFVTNAIANAQLGSGEVDLSGYATVDALNLKADLTHTHDQYLTKVPDIYALKTDANKMNCVTVDNGSLKEYILTNCTETGKTYYLIAKTTCTDLPKASNFYITVETPGMYTYKVIAKELNDSNGIYVCTYRTISSTWTEWEKVALSSDLEGIPGGGVDTTSFATDLSLTGSSLQLKNSQGNLIGNAVTLPSSGGGSSEILPKVVLFGDSITDPNANGEWFKVIRNYATFKSLKNYARGYCTWANKSDTEYNINDTSDANVSSNVIWNQYNRMVKDIENHVIEVPDCVVILCGGNDAIMNKEIGDPDTVFDGNAQSTEANAHTTTSSAIRFVCELLMTNYPTTQIILTTPIQMGTKAYNDRILLTREAIIKCCNKMGVKVIDQTYESGVYQYRESVRKYNLKADNIHLTPEGGDTVARYLAREFKNKINDRYISGNSSSTVVNVESISLDKTSTSMISGNTITLTATITPSNATNKNVTWSSNSENAILTPNGLSCKITSSTVGVYTVTATAQDGGASSSCTISVIQEGSSEADASLIKYIDFRDGDNETKPTKITDRVDKYEYTISGATSFNQWITSSTHDVGWKDSGARFYSEQYVRTGITKFNYNVPSKHTFEFACSIDDFSTTVNLLSIRKTWTDMKYQVAIINDSTIRLQNGGGLSLDGTYSFKTDVIYHFAIVKSESKIALYINGQNVIPETTYKSQETSESMPLQPFGIEGTCLSGLYCYFKLYNTALSIETIQSNYEVESALRTMDR